MRKTFLAIALGLTLGAAGTGVAAYSTSETIGHLVVTALASIKTLVVTGSITAPDITVSDDLAVTSDLSVGGDLAVTDDVTADDVKANSLRGEATATQVIGAAGTIAADACGGVKRISSAAAVTTSTTNTFTAPAAANEGCVLWVYNVNAADAITLDNNVLFESTDGADVVLVAKGRIGVVSTGEVWIQITTLGDNLT